MPQAPFDELEQLELFRVKLLGPLPVPIEVGLRIAARGLAAERSPPVAGCFANGIIHGATDGAQDPSCARKIVQLLDALHCAGVVATRQLHSQLFVLEVLAALLNHLGELMKLCLGPVLRHDLEQGRANQLRAALIQRQCHAIFQLDTNMLLHVVVVAPVGALCRFPLLPKELAQHAAQPSVLGDEPVQAKVILGLGR